MNEARMAKEAAREALNLLHGFSEPTEGEVGDLAGIRLLLTTIAERFASADDQLTAMREQLSAIEQRLPARRGALRK